MAQLGEWHRLQALRDILKAGGIAWIEAPLLMHCVTRLDGRAIAETEALKMSNLTNMVTSVVCSDFSLLAIVRSIINFSAVFGIEYGLFFLAVQMVHIVDDTVLSNFLSGNSSQTNQRCIYVANFLFQRSNTFNIFESLGGKETGYGILGSLNHDDGLLFLS